MLDKRKFYINGKWISSSKPNDFEVINPSNENPYAIISLGYKEDVKKLVEKEQYRKYFSMINILVVTMK